MDPNLDLDTFELGDFGFGDLTVTVPAGRQFYNTRLDLRPTRGLFVDVTAELDRATRTVTWTFQALDPQTMDLPIDPSVGFLPPDQAAPEGEGFVSFSVAPEADLPTGTSIDAQATVVFDTNPPLDTNVFPNALDGGPPTSSVKSLPTFSPATFPVNSGGQDDADGSGIATFDVFVSDNGGPFALWQSATSATTAAYTGVDGHSYAFYSVAADNVGNVQPTPAGAQTVTTVDAVAPTSTVAALPQFSPASFTITWSGSDNAGGSGLANYSVFVSDNGGTFAAWLTGTTQTSAAYIGQAGHTYGFSSIATDNAGNAQPTPTAVQASTTVQYCTGTQFTSSAPNNTGPQGQAVTFTAAVNNAVSGGPTPTGKVDFIDTTTGKDLGAFVLTNGRASVTTAALPLGQNIIVASYLADAAFITSSDSLTETVTSGGPSDITSQVSVVKGGYRRLSSGLWVQQVTITNTSGGAIAGPVTLGLKSLKGGTLASATVNGAAAPVLSAQDGSPYIPLVASGDVFAVNQQLTVVLDFTDPYNLALSWVAQLLAGPGQR